MSTNGPTDAAEPFDKLQDNPRFKADVILRSRDNVDFRTFKLLLSLASPIFADMFDLSGLALESSVNEMKDGVPVIQMEESGRTLDILLRFCHPNCVATLESLDAIGDTLAAAAKYEMDAVLKWAREALIHTPLAETRRHPVRAFAIALQNGLDEEARVLAKATLCLSVHDLYQELEYITDSRTRQRLNAYHEDCRRAVRRLTYCYDWITLDKEDAIWNSHHRGGCGSNIARTIYFKDWDRGWPKEWWLEYMGKVGETLEVRPTASTVLSPGLVDWVVEKTRGCEDCRRFDAPGQIRKLNVMLSDEVERVISKVRGIWYLKSQPFPADPRAICRLSFRFSDVNFNETLKQVAWDCKFLSEY